MSVTFFADGFESQHELNVSNSNAVHLLGVLGLPTDELFGEEPAESFLGRVLLAQGLNPTDEGVPAHELTEPGSTMVLVDCGRRVGYTDERLSVLRSLADDAVGRDTWVVWG